MYIAMTFGFHVVALADTVVIVLTDAKYHAFTDSATLLASKERYLNYKRSYLGCQAGQKFF